MTSIRLEGTRTTSPAGCETKPAVWLGGLSREVEETFNLMTSKEKSDAGQSGVFHEMRLQPKVNRIAGPAETKVGRGPDNNAFITIGNDRVSKLTTGYGAKSHTQCDAIDIVAGLGGHQPKQTEREEDPKTNEPKPILTNPNFFVDAARIYISQKTDIDVNFGIGKEEDRELSNAKSGIAVKADNVRLIGRESLKLVTRTDKLNSQGCEIRGKTGIWLVANNDEDKLQPMVLGDNLIKCLKRVNKNIESITNWIHAYSKYQQDFNRAVQQHYHVSPFFGQPTLPSLQCIESGVQMDINHSAKTELSVVKSVTNVKGCENNYLSPNGNNYILSENNKVN